MITIDDFCAGLSRLDTALVRGAVGHVIIGGAARTRTEWNQLVAQARQRPINPS